MKKALSLSAVSVHALKVERPALEVLPRPEYTQANKASLAALGMRWIKANAHMWSSATMGMYGRAVVSFSSWLGGRTLTPAVAQQWFDEQVACKRTHYGVNFNLTPLRMMFKWAVEKNLVECNPFENVKNTIPPAPFRRDVFTRAEYVKMKDASRGTLVFPFVVIAYNTGLRGVDIFGLQWKDIDYDQQILRRRPQKTLRTGAEARIPFPSGSDLAEVLFQLRAATPERDPEGHVFPQYNDTYRSSPRGKLKTDFAMLLKKLNIRGRRFHSFRRTFLTNLASSGCDSVIAMHMTGITNLNTLKHYIVPSAEAMRQALAKAQQFSELL